MNTHRTLLILTLLTSLAALPAAVLAQAADAAQGAPGGGESSAEEASEASTEPDAEGEEGEEELASFFAATTVTATGSEVDAFTVSTPVTVISEEEIQRRSPENAVDLLRGEAGVDVNGVGPNQARPIIRGQRGLRILFMENGLRLNNPRRQTDFGEISGLVDLDSVNKVEVVRGPASVLYGTDAIGGVLNLITKTPPYGDGSWIAGSLGLRYASASEMKRAQGSVSGRRERFSFHLGGSYRDAKDYEAAAGTFGDITLDEEVPVLDTALTDDSLYGTFGYQISDRHELALRFTRYRADETGFGLVDPAAIGDEEDFRIRIFYPYQDFDRYTLSYFGSALESALADSADVQVYYQTNERQLANDIDINIGPIFPGAPDSSVAADTLNFTDLDTVGGRAELIKVGGERHLITYGAEFFRDESYNTDFSTTTTTIRFPFPPFEVEDVSTDAVPNAPNATNSSYGFFAQDEILLGESLKVTLGARYQDVETRADFTPGLDTTGLDFSDDSVVGSVSFAYQVREYLNLVGSYGTAFRAPNIVERLFNGPTPEGAGFQVLNPDLVSEESEGFDIGFKYRRRNAIFEAIYFRNDIDNGIIQDFLSAEEVAQLPPEVQQAIRDSRAQFIVQQRNVDRLRYEGVEVIVGYRTRKGISFGGNYTYVDAKRIERTPIPTGDTVPEKASAYVRWNPPRGRWWLEYRVRYNGSDKARLDPGDPVPPVGEEIPSFTIHQLAGGWTFFDNGSQRHRLSVVIENLTDELYAEFSNATFFRPQPKRDVVVSYRLEL